MSQQSDTLKGVNPMKHENNQITTITYRSGTLVPGTLAFSGKGQVIGGEVWI